MSRPVSRQVQPCSSSVEVECSVGTAHREPSAYEPSGVEAGAAVLVVGEPYRGAAWAAPGVVLPADQNCRPRLQPLGAGAGGAVAFGEQAFAGPVP